MSISAIQTEVDLPESGEVKHYFYKYILTTYDVVDSLSDALNPEKIKQPSQRPSSPFTIAVFQAQKCVLLMISHANGEGKGTPLQYSCLENPMDRGAWWAAVHGVAQSWIRLSDLTFTFHFHALEKEMATLSSVLAWRIPGTGEPGVLPSMGSHRVGHDGSDLAAAAIAATQIQKQHEIS